MTTDVLLFEPRYEGHHLPWSGMIAQTLIDAGLTVRFAHGQAPTQLIRFDDAFPLLRSKLDCITVPGDGSSLAELVAVSADCKQILVPNLDAFASNMFRRAAILPSLPRTLHRKLFGIYHRPRPLDPSEGGVGIAWKRLGFNRLMKRNPLRGIGVLDEDLIEHIRGPVVWIPDFWRPLVPTGRDSAREAFGIPAHARALLFFGVSHRRKGLDLAIEAFEQANLGNAILFVAGKQVLEPPMMHRLNALVTAGKAVVHDRYLSEDEMGAAFFACDDVLVPYRSHYGSSNVLSTAASIGRPVIASDHHLIGRRVRREHLGVVFADRSSSSLASAIASPHDGAACPKGMERWAQRTSPSMFSQAILSLLAL